jgi:hypothetical protein
MNLDTVSLIQAIISISQEEYYEKHCNECLALTADIQNSDEHAQA